MSNQALQTIPDQSIVPADVSASALQSALAGDLAKLSGEDRLKFYAKLCEFTGLNPLSKPFDWITFQGKLTLYPNKGCAEQLRKLHGISFEPSYERRVEFGLMVMTVHGSDKTSRKDFATAALPFDEKMPAADRATALMKLETKAKRRFTLSICGLSMFARDSEDAEETEPERPLVEDTVSDRAAKLNASLTGAEKEAAIDLGAAPTAGDVSTTTAAPPQSSTGAIKPNESGAAEEVAQRPLPTHPGSPPVSEPDLPQDIGGLSDELASRVEAVFAERIAAGKSPHDAIRCLISKGKLKPGQRVQHLDEFTAGIIIRSPKKFNQTVDDWVQHGGK